MKIEYIQKKPFCVFVVKNFLTFSEYNYLKKNFYKIERNKFKKLFGNKYSVNEADPLYKILKSKNNAIKLIEEKFNEKFFIKIFQSLKKHIVFSRAKFITLTEIIRIYKKPTIKKNNNFFNKFFKSSFRRNIQLSYMERNSYITPHTDKKSKLISLMLYFPSKNLENSNIGTHFFNGGETNFENNPNKTFPKNSKKVFSLPFTGRHLYGFIKSDMSWHYVKKLNIKKNEIRKSININLHSH